MPKSDDERFWERVDKSGGPQACWPWAWAKHQCGYGIFHVRKEGKWKQIPSHRFAYQSAYGPIPQGKIVRHLVCDNPPCCNPSHLAMGTYQDNSDDMVRKGRQRRGANHPNTLHPEHMPRGENHPWRRHPEKICRGERNGNARITEALVRALRAEYIPRKVGTSFLAQKYHLSQANVWLIVKRQAWKHVN